MSSYCQILFQGGWTQFSFRQQCAGISFGPYTPKLHVRKYYFFKCLLVLRERQSMNKGGAESERETQNPKRAPGSERSAQSPSRGSNSRTVRSRPEPKSDTQPTEPPERLELLIVWNANELKCKRPSSHLLDSAGRLTQVTQVGQVTYKAGQSFVVCRIPSRLGVGAGTMWPSRSLERNAPRTKLTHR